MPTGTVKWFNVTKGYGFIEPNERGKDIFVHITKVQQSGMERLLDGQKIGYDLEQGRNGRMAAANLRQL